MNYLYQTFGSETINTFGSETPQWVSDKKIRISERGHGAARKGPTDYIGKGAFLGKSGGSVFRKTKGLNFRPLGFGELSLWPVWSLQEIFHGAGSLASDPKPYSSSESRSS